MIETATASVTYLFSDIEGSTRLWEADPLRAERTVAWHDEISRAAVQHHRGTVVKTTGDGIHAVFDDPLDAVSAVVELQLALAEPAAEYAPIGVRCGLHLGADQRRDNDFFGQAVNRAARIMGAAHGGQVLLSSAVADRLAGRLPPGVMLRDLGVVRLRDLGSPEHVFQVVHPALRSDFPALRSLATTPNNLAQQLNSFIGRDDDMVQVQQLLANSRLLTMLGMGGLGKSRLSVQVAAIVLDSYPDGVWFVELAALSDPRLVPQAVASVLAVKEESSGTVMDALVRFVKDKHVLIVLDNCEHVVQACAELAKRLLEAGPKVKVLASSRDSLRIAGEVVFAVAPLPAPERADAPSIDALMTIDSVRLFVDRAKSVQPAFRLTQQSARSVAEICRSLDGIPLAIELAAARVRAMSAEQIAARLDDRFRLLNRGERTALPRQRTLRALIDWSHDLLDAKERALFRRLAVFAGGWTLEAAEEVGVGGEVAPEDVLDLLSNLVEKSLVAMDTKTGRYRMLDTVRQYALEKLIESSEEAPTREQHLAFLLQVVERALPHLFGSEQGTWMARLDLDRENVLAAHEWCDKSPVGAEAGVRLVAALKYYWLNRGLLNQGYAIAHEAINRPAVQRSAAIHCRGLVDAGIIAYFMGRYVEARDQLERGLAIARRLNDRSRQVDVLQLLGPVEFALGNRESALDLCDDAERLARQSQSRRELISSLTAKAQLLRALGRLHEASSLYAEVLAWSRDLGDEESVAASLLNLAAVAVLMRQMSAARSMLREVAAITSRIGSRAAGQSLLEVCAGLAEAAGDAPRGNEFLKAAEEQAARSGLRRDPADEIFVVGVKRRLQSNLGTVATSGEAAIQNSTYDIAIARATLWLDEPSVAD